MQIRQLSHGSSPSVWGWRLLNGSPVSDTQKLNQCLANQRIYPADVSVSRADSRPSCSGMPMFVLLRKRSAGGYTEVPSIGAFRLMHSLRMFGQGHRSGLANGFLQTPYESQHLYERSQSRERPISARDLCCAAVGAECKLLCVSASEFLRDHNVVCGQSHHSRLTVKVEPDHSTLCTVRRLT
jgi:hypothetical protein